MMSLFCRDFWSRYETLREHYKYAVNYDHIKAVMIVNREPFTDAGFVILRHDTSLTPPMAVVSYEFYDSPEMPRREAERLKAGCSAWQVTGTFLSVIRNSLI